MPVIKIILSIISVLLGAFYMSGGTLCLVETIRTNKRLRIETDFGNEVMPCLFFIFTGLFISCIPFISV